MVFATALTMGLFAILPDENALLRWLDWIGGALGGAALCALVWQELGAWRLRDVPVVWMSDNEVRWRQRLWRRRFRSVSLDRVEAISWESPTGIGLRLEDRSTAVIRTAGLTTEERERVASRVRAALRSAKSAPSS